MDSEKIDTFKLIFSTFFLTLILHYPPYFFIGVTISWLIKYYYIKFQFINTLPYITLITFSIWWFIDFRGELKNLYSDKLVLPTESEEE
ncbi:MAG: hypothetical protein EKK61_00055 [Rickettsiales bacterium]|nr:MAG: hypothetical protein EKK61_00055 [Rickettsiales bacterium]